MYVGDIKVRFLHTIDAPFVDLVVLSLPNPPTSSSLKAAKAPSLFPLPLNFFVANNMLRSRSFPGSLEMQ